MIFQHTFENVLSANKTQTRRVIKSGDSAIRGRYNQIESVLINGRLKWTVGGTYSVQSGRGQPSIAKIKLTRINSQIINYISTQDAIAEGFHSRSEFLDTWKMIHGDDSLNLRVWIITFELVAIKAQDYPLRKLTSVLQTQ